MSVSRALRPKRGKMKKRPNHRALRASRTYTIEEAACVLGVTVGSIRNWIGKGLPVMKTQRPHLILGEDLKDFLQERARAGKAPLDCNELYCLTCKSARKPWGMLVDCVLQNGSTARLVGLCEACGGTCNRMISRSRIGQFAEIFVLQTKGEKTA
jgi:hypothetical protein